MAQLLVSFAVSYILTRLSQQDGPRLSNLNSFSADYGATIPKIFGPENRASQNSVIWATPIKETTHKHKPATDFLFGVVGALLPPQKTYTYSVSFAALVCDNPITAIKRMWINKRLMYDGVGTPGTYNPSGMAAMRIYGGSFTQLPDPTMEAVKGVGNVPAYLGSTYVVIDTLQLADFGNAVPSEVEFEVEEAATATLARVVLSMAVDSGIDHNTVGTSGVEGPTIRGLIISSSTNVADAFQPLASAYAFDVADVCGSLRFVPRGRYPKSVITQDQLPGYGDAEDRPETIRFTRAPEIGLPQEVTVNFFDPARDYQPNSQTSRRSGGSSQSNIVVDSNLVLTPTEALKMADRVMWEAWSARQTASTTTTDQRDDVTVSEVHAIQTATGIDTFRILRRSRGANGVIELDLAADRPLLYDSTTPGVPAPTPAVSTIDPEPINPPIFIEPPSDLAGNSAQVWAAISGGSGVLASGGSTGIADPNWPGVSVWVATTDSEANYRAAGRIDTPAFMGVLTKPLDLTSGAEPDLVGVLGVDLVESAGILESVSASDAAGGAINLAYVESPLGGGEFMTFQNQVATQPHVYDCTTLYRGLHGSEEVAHTEGENFALVDDALYRFSLPADLVGIPLFFKFVQPNQALADVTAYLYTPSGKGFGSGAGGTPAAIEGVNATPGINQNVVTWDAAPVSDNVSEYQVFRAPSLAQPFSAATQVATVSALTYTDTNLAAGTGYTYFVLPVNVIGPATAPGSGADTTTSTTTPTQAGITFSAASIGTKPLATVVARYPITFTQTMPATLPHSRGKVSVGPTAQTDFDLQVDGVSVGTVRFAIGATTPTFIKAADTVLVESDYLDLVTPANLNGMSGAFGLTINTVK